MKRLLLSTLLMLTAVSTWAQRFEDYFEDRTLRIDYTFSGNHERQQLYVDELVALPRWYGRRQRLAELPLKGNGQLTVRAKSTGDVIYRHSFSSLFQECITGTDPLIDDGLTGGGSSSVTTSFMPPRKKLRYPLAHWEIILNFAA